MIEKIDREPITVSRRRVLQLLGAATTLPAATWLLAACGDDDDEETPAPGAGDTAATEAPEDEEEQEEEEETPDETDAEEPAAGGELIVGLDQEPPTLDPHASPSAITFQIMSSVAEALLYLDADRQLQPWLAESWEAANDGQSYTFVLRQDVTFHDGETFSTETVQWNFDRIVSPDFVAGGSLAALAGYTGCEIVDEYTVTVNFEEPYAPFLTYAAGATLAMVSPAAAQELGDEFGTQVVASGPFIVDSYTANDNTTVVRNEEYNRTPPWSDREGPPLLDRIVFKFIPEPGTRVTTLETGETDLITVVPSQDLPRIEGSDDYTVNKIPWVGLPRILMLNTQLAPTDDVNVRRAVSLAINRQALVDTVFAGTGEVAIGMLARVMLDDESLSQPHDPEQARQLLEEAGWVDTGGDFREKDGERLHFILNVVDSGGGAPPEAQLIQADLLDVGFDCEIKAQARAPWYEDNYNCRTHGPLMFLRSGDYDGLYSMFHSSLIGQNFGFACLNDPEIDEMLEQGRSETDPDARRELYLEIEQTLADMAVAAPLVDEYSVWAGRNRVQGLAFNGYTYPVFGDVSVEE